MLTLIVIYKFFINFGNSYNIFKLLARKHTGKQACPKTLHSPWRNMDYSNSF